MTGMAMITKSVPANHRLFNLRNGSRFEERWSAEKARQDARYLYILL
jgi:hypothetical protein